MTSISFAPKLGILSLRGALIAISDEGRSRQIAACANLRYRPSRDFLLRLLIANKGLSGILCGGPVSLVEEPLAKDDGELCLCLDPFPRRPFSIARPRC